MEALRDLVIMRTGYPRYGALSQAAEESGIGESQLSRVVNGKKAGITPETLRQFARWLGKDYNELLLTVLGDQESQRTDYPPHPTTPHEQALRVVDVMAAAMVELRRALEAMGQASQPDINSRMDHSPTQTVGDYLYQTPPRRRVLFALPTTPRIGDRLRLLTA